MPWWYKTWQLSGYSPTRANQKLLRKPRRACRSSWSRQGNQNSFTLTLPLNLASLVGESSWNHCTSTPHRSDTNGIGIAERAVRRVKERTSAVLLQSGLDENWWAASWNFTPICETFNIYYLMGRHHVKARFGKPFNGSVVPFGAMVEYHPISAKDVSRLHQFGPKVLPGKFLGYVLYAVGIWKGDIMLGDVEELEQMDASGLHARRLNAKEV